MMAGSPAGLVLCGMRTMMRPTGSPSHFPDLGECRITGSGYDGPIKLVGPVRSVSLSGGLGAQGYRSRACVNTMPKRPGRMAQAFDGEVASPGWFFGDPSHEAHHVIFRAD